MAPHASSPFPTISCDNHVQTYPPPREDTDLLDIANILLPDRYTEPGFSVSHAPPAKPSSKKVLLVGTSFLFAIQSHLERAAAVKEAGLYFYARSFRSNTTSALRPLPPNRAPWNDFWTCDAIIIEINEASLLGAGHGFVPAALKALKTNHPAPAEG